MTNEEIDKKVSELERLKEVTVQQANVEIGRILGKIELLRELREETKAETDGQTGAGI